MIYDILCEYDYILKAAMRHFCISDCFGWSALFFCAISIYYYDMYV